MPKLALFFVCLAEPVLAHPMDFQLPNDLYIGIPVLRILSGVLAQGFPRHLKSANAKSIDWVFRIFPATNPTEWSKRP